MEEEASMHTRLSVTLVLAIIMAALALGATPRRVDASTDVVVLSALLTGAAEVPPADRDGVGVAGVVIVPGQNLLCYSVAVRNIAPATAAHIHAGAVGVNGPVVVPLLPPTRGHSFECLRTVAATLLQDIAANPAAYYVNVHNAEFENGAIRGQLQRVGR
jgi:hypothetical protein